MKYLTISVSRAFPDDQIVELCQTINQQYPGEFKLLAIVNREVAEPEFKANELKTKQA